MDDGRRVALDIRLLGAVTFEVRGAGVTGQMQKLKALAMLILQGLAYPLIDPDSHRC